MVFNCTVVGVVKPKSRTAASNSLAKPKAANASGADSGAKSGAATLASAATPGWGATGVTIGSGRVTAGVASK